MELADAVAPIFDRLYKKNEDELEDEADRTEGLDENGDPMPGGGTATDPDGYPEELSGTPSKSPMGNGQEPLTTKDLLEIMREEAKGLGKEHLKALEQLEAALEHAAERAMDQIGGREAGDGHDDSEGEDNLWNDRKSVLRVEIGSLKRQFKAVLTTNMASNWLEGQRKGQFNSRRARRAVAGDNRIFRKRQTIGDIDYTIGIVVDVSGSMGEGDISGRPKWESALDACVILTEAAEGAGLKTFIVPVDTQTKRVKGVFTPLNDAVRGTLSWDLQPAGGTNVAPGMVTAQDELAKAQGSRRILFVISDGETSDPAGCAALEEEIRQMGIPTAALAIGLDEDALPHHSLVVHLSEAGEMVRVIPRLINQMVMHKGGH